MKKLLYAFLLIGVSSALNPVFAEPAKVTAKKEVTKKTQKKVVPAKAAAPAAAISSDDDEEDLGEANIEGSVVTNFNCELGNKISTYYNDGDDRHIAIRWKNKVHRLRKIGTSTGAHRFENRKAGLVWIQIPSKAMLLDSKKGQQLANECKSAGQASIVTGKTLG